MLSFLVRLCFDHDQHTRFCPVLRFLNPNQITSGILASLAHFSHNNSHTPLVPYLLEAPVHRLSAFQSIYLHAQTGHILHLQYPSDTKYRNEYSRFANPALLPVPYFLLSPHYPDTHTDQMLLQSHPMPLPAVLWSSSQDTLLLEHPASVYTYSPAMLHEFSQSLPVPVQVLHKTEHHPSDFQIQYFLLRLQIRLHRSNCLPDHDR